MNPQTQKLYLDKQKLQTEREVLGREYSTLKEQVLKINDKATAVMLKIQKNIDKAQAIADKLLEMEYEALKKEGL